MMEELRIEEFITPGIEIKTFDFTLLGLNPTPWSFNRGARVERTYKNDSGEVVVLDRYSYDYIEGGRSISGYQRHIEWMTTDGEVGESKDVTGQINIKNLKTLNRELRQGRIDYLEASAEELRIKAANVPSPYFEQYMAIADSIDVLFSHYSTQVVEYISRGTLKFETDVLGETIPGILQILAIPSDVPSPKFPNGLTVRDSILYQIRGYLSIEGDVIES